MAVRDGRTSQALYEMVTVRYGLIYISSLGGVICHVILICK